MLVAFTGAESEGLAVIPHKHYPMSGITIGGTEPALVNAHGEELTKKFNPWCFCTIRAGTVIVLSLFEEE